MDDDSKGPAPTAVELTDIAVRLFGAQKVLDSTTRVKCFADALAVWRDAEVMAKQANLSELDIESARMPHLAQESDILRTWDDRDILTTWGKEDSQSATPGQIVPVTPDAIRKHLIRVFGADYGNAFFYGGRHFGVSRTSAGSLRALTEQMETEPDFAAVWRRTARPADLALRIWHPDGSQTATIEQVETWIADYLRKRVASTPEKSPLTSE